MLTTRGRLAAWDVPSLLIWACTGDYVLTLSEGGALRQVLGGVDAGDNVGLSLEVFGDGVKPALRAVDRAMLGQSSIVATSAGGVQYLNLIGPRYDGRGRPLGALGVSWIVEASGAAQLAQAARELLAAFDG
jgi:hypothetical protein